MNFITLQQVIAQYKNSFDYIHDLEIYKWRAIQHFQDHWNIDANDFEATLKQSLSFTKNLMDSGRYYPRRMIFRMVERVPEQIRLMFRELYNEDADLANRIHAFRQAAAKICKVYFPGKNPFQDHRAILVYLSLRYPDRYYLYKFEMFKQFCEIIDYPVRDKIRAGQLSNVMQYESMCEIIRSVIEKDNELLRMHQGRLKSRQEYADIHLTVLTQDVIYAATTHLKNLQVSLPNAIAIIEVDEVLTCRERTPSLSGHQINWIEREEKARAVGNIGELMILEYENALLKAYGINKQAEQVSKTKGDGLGYDILSYTKDGKEKYIEVKSTRGDYRGAFYITASELKKSMQSSDQFYLYRLFAMNEVTKTGMLIVRPGSLESLCVYPDRYFIDTHEPE
jgi:hypothetical protein